MLARREVLRSATGMLATSALGAGAVGATVPSRSMLLWPSGAPGALGQIPLEQITERSNDPSYHDRALTQIGHPRIDIFPAAHPNGASVLLIPGGGYARVVVDKEGYEMAAWLNACGITAFVLIYRLPAEGWAEPTNVSLADAQRAMRLIRAHADQFNVDPARVSAMGFSAGGHVCARLMTRYDAPLYTAVDAADAESARPTLAAPIYPVISMSLPEAHAGSRLNLLGAAPTDAAENAASPHLHIRKDTPPTFLTHAADDDVVPVANTLMLNEALRAAHIPTEMHIFERGGHGFGLRLARGKPVAIWPELWRNWARQYIEI